VTTPDYPVRPSPAVQDYLKAIYRIQEDSGRPIVVTSEVADALAVTPPSASAMLKKMGQLGFVAPTDKRGAVELTEAGRTAALEVVRHHRLLETYLVTRLGVPWDQVHHEAEILEHHLSEELEARIAEALGHPERDPHGDPIPTLAGEVPAATMDLLSDLPEGDTAIVSRVGDQDPAMLRYLAEHGLVPDAAVEMIGHGAFGGPLRIRVAGDAVIEVPREAARVVRVAPD
jgi:DtxR family transcriptional regulator, Mn-dependent transcriptional regulator